MKHFILLSLVVVLSLGFTTFLKTSLTITVRDETGNIVAGATIKLYAKKEDYEKEVNPIAEGTTDEKGVAKFKELTHLSIFMLVQKGDKDNTGGGEQTKLEQGKINKVTVVIQ
jgi:Prealbumin-like fold domain